MKKIFSCLITMVILVTTLGINTTYAQSKNVSSSELLDNCMRIGKNFLYDYYSSIDMKQDLNTANYIDETNLLSNYLELKHDIMKNRLIRSNCEVSNFSIDISCFDYDILDNKVNITYNVLIKHQYKGCDEMSESMQQVKLSLENNNRIIYITNYFEINEFDVNVNLLQNKNNNNSNLTSSEDKIYQLNFNENAINILEDTLEKENKFYDKCDIKTQFYKMNNSDIPSLISDINNVSSTSRNNIVTYAKNNCSETQPNSGNSSCASYYDFSEITGAYDCTNFASHCMLAGGANENHNDWYYDSLSSRSSSWSGVNQFHDFIVSNTGSGPQADDRSIAYNCPAQYVNWENGDIIQLQYPDYGYPGFGHSTIVTGYYSANYYSNTPMVTSRTGDYWYTKNEVLTVKYPISNDILAYRLIHLTDFE